MTNILHTFLDQTMPAFSDEQITYIRAQDPNSQVKNIYWSIFQSCLPGENISATAIEEYLLRVAGNQMVRVIPSYIINILPNIEKLMTYDHWWTELQEKKHLVLIPIHLVFGTEAEHWGLAVVLPHRPHLPS
jgi:hypothetical protein